MAAIFSIDVLLMYMRERESRPSPSLAAKCALLFLSSLPSPRAFRSLAAKKFMTSTSSGLRHRGPHHHNAAPSSSSTAGSHDGGFHRSHSDIVGGGGGGRNRHAADGSDDDLSSSLLGNAEPVERGGRATRDDASTHRRSHSAGPKGGGASSSSAPSAAPVVLSGFFSTMSRATTWMLDVLPNTWASVFIPTITAQDTGRVRDFEADCVVPVDKNLPHHREMLVRLWTEFHRAGVACADFTANAARPGSRTASESQARFIPPTVQPLASLVGDLDAAGDLVSHHWKQFGFQGTDPTTDFRGAGLLALHNLLHLAEHHPRSFRSFVAFEVPFAIASINVTMALLNLLGLRGATTCLSTTQPNSSYTAQMAKSTLTFWISRQPNLSPSANASFPMRTAMSGKEHHQKSDHHHHDDSGGSSVDAASSSASHESHDAARHHHRRHEAPMPPLTPLQHHMLDAFCEVHRVACEVLYTEWQKSPRNIMEFNSILKRAMTGVEGHLRDFNGKTLEAFLQWWDITEHGAASP